MAREMTARGFTGAFTVEDVGDGYQAVYPSELADLGAVYGTEQEAWDAIMADCGDHGIELTGSVPPPPQTGRE